MDQNHNLFLVATAFLGRWFSNGHLNHMIRIGDRSIVTAGTHFDFVHMVHSFDHLSPNRVLAVKKWGRFETDKKLTVGTIGTG